METSYELIKKFEGFRNKPYLCPAGVPTIGYGSTHYADGRPVTLADDIMSEKDAHGLMLFELQSRYLPKVIRYCPILIKYPKSLNAIVDFCYNLGVGRLQTSTLRRELNAGDWEGAQEQLRKWVRGGGKILPGLVARREAEAALLPVR